MSAKQRTDQWLVHAAGVTVAAMVANAPVVAAVATVAAAVYAASRQTSRAFASSGPGGLKTAAFHGFEGDDALLHDVSSDQSEATPEDTRSETEQAVDDLTADLDDGENISFLPPYASGKAPAVERSDTEPLAVLWEPPPDDSLLALLSDILEPNSRMSMPRRFALGTVAILRNLLQPTDVERILSEQKRYPRLRFGDVAVQLGMLSEDELGEVLAAQQEGVFSNEEIIDARARLQAYHTESAHRESA